MRRARLLRRMPAVVRLLLNHMDAWGTTLIIAALALLIHDTLSVRSLFLLLALTAGYWLAFALNDYFDAPFDKVDPVKAARNVFVHGGVSRTKGLLGLAVMSVFLFVAFAQFGLRGYLTLIVSLFIMWGYSAPPLRFKSRPGLDLLIHAVFVETFPYFICLFLIGATWKRLDYVMLLILFLSSLAAQLEQQIRDFAVDARTGRTFATVAGLKRTRLLLRIVTAALVLVAVVNLLNGTIPLFIAAFGLITLPIILHRLLHPRSEAPRPEKLVYASAATALFYTGLILLRAVLS